MTATAATDTDYYLDQKPPQLAAVSILSWFDRECGEATTNYFVPVHFYDVIEQDDVVLVKPDRDCQKGRVFIDFGEHEFPLMNLDGSYKFEEGDIALRACLRISFNKAEQCFYFKNNEDFNYVEDDD